MKGEALWPFALELYARPGAEALLLELQDAHAQSVPYLIWSLWLAANDRAADPSALRAAAELVRAWEGAATGPLRALRRRLKAAGPSSQQRQRERLRQKVKGLELDAERMLLRMLETQVAATPAAGADPLAALAGAVAAWGAPAPPDWLRRLAELAG